MKKHLTVLSACAVAALLVTTNRAVAQREDGRRSIQSYGAATPGANKTSPFLWPLVTARPGEKNYGLTLTNARTNAGIVAFYSFRPADFMFRQVRVLIDLGLAQLLPLATTDANGQFTWKLPLPNRANLIGFSAVHQAYIADPSANSIGISASQGLRVTAARSAMVYTSAGAAVDLTTGRVTSFGIRGNDVALYGKGRYVLVPSMTGGSRRTRKTDLYDASFNPPRLLKSHNSPPPATPNGPTMFPWSVAVTPDDTRAYIVHQGPRGSNPVVQVVHAVPGLFGRAIGSIPMGAVIDPLYMEFTSDSKIGILGTLGLFGGGAQLRKIDTDPRSTNYNKQVGLWQGRSRFMFGFARVTDTVFAAAHSSLGGTTVVDLIDIRTMKRVTRIAGTGFGPVSWGLVADPRGHILYVANNGNGRNNSVSGIARIIVDPSDPKYRTVTWITDKIRATGDVKGLAVSDAGDRLYAVIDSNVRVYDAATLKEVGRYRASAQELIVR